MPNKLNVIVIVCLLFLTVVGCTLADVSDTEINKETVSVLIIGSAEHPDPVLEMVQELEKKGILQNVIVRESFPVQIEVTGPRSIIEKLQEIPRKESPNSGLY
ncbi:hypothetical protein MNBD_GAMMA26-1759 [hydrothermal vent metagenome]|uniref:Uncharacterized protein n=1 Tax=hydrothermal vent metagenome TaxID=652676 RepID=A0A3B1APD7_9ZZZZ